MKETIVKHINTVRHCVFITIANLCPPLNLIIHNEVTFTFTKELHYGLQTCMLKDKTISGLCNRFEQKNHFVIVVMLSEIKKKF